MKNLLAIAVVLISFNSFASTVEDAVKAVEVEKNAQCTFANQSTLKKCFGVPEMQTCFYTKNYNCVSNAGNFGLKIRVKDFYNLETNAYETKVRGTVITK